MKKENTILNILSAIFVIAFVFLKDPITDFRNNIVRDKYAVNGWERVSKIESQHEDYSTINYDAGDEILWMVTYDDKFFKIDINSPDQFQSIDLDLSWLPTLCIGEQSVYLTGYADADLIDKDDLDTVSFLDFYHDEPKDCLLDGQGNVIVYSDGWYGVYNYQFWQFLEGIVWNGERLHIAKILGPYQNTLFLMTSDDRLFSISESFDDINYIGDLSIDLPNIMYGGIASNKMLWLGIYGGEFYGWMLPFDAENLAPNIELYSKFNQTFDVFIDQGGRTWMIRSDDIIVMTGQDDFVTIKMPYKVDEINSAYINENTQQIFIGTESGIYRSTIDTLLAKNGLDD